MTDGLTVVKFLASGFPDKDHPFWLRQFPHSQPVWGNCRFVFDQEARDYDWLVVYNDLPGRSGERRSLRVEPLACPRNQTMLITMEPSSVKVYGSDYMAQFGVVLASLEPWAVPHRHVIFTQCGLQWFYGVGTAKVVTHDDMKARQPPVKERTISTVCSTKAQFHTLHRQRYEFTQKLKQALPELDIFGHGVRFIADKAEALDSYRYHVAVENHVCQHHWTEKLADPLLGYCLPFYHGCPNAADYFPPESFIPINIADFDGTLATIREAIATNQYEKRLPAIIEARRRVLDEHNIFALIARTIAAEPAVAAGQRADGGMLYSRYALRRHRPLTAVRFLFEKIWQRARHGRLHIGGA
jgi:hypothetical protein